jgi:hypothetical protein
MIDPNEHPRPVNPVEGAKELPVPDGVMPEVAKQIREWVQSIVDERVLALIPYLKRGLAEGVYAENLKVLREQRKLTRQIRRNLEDQAREGDEWKHGRTTEDDSDE